MGAKEAERMASILEKCRTWFMAHVYSLPTRITIRIARLLPLRNDILFESKPAFTDNTLGVYEELLRRGYNQKFRFVWVTTGAPVETDLPKNVKILNVNRSPLHKWIIGSWVAARARYILDCNEFVHKVNPKTVRIHLKHGLEMKDAHVYNQSIGDVDVICVPSAYWVQTTAQSYAKDPSVIKPLGFPRNEVLLTPKTHEQKTIIWMPTFRYTPYYADEFPETLRAYQKDLPFGLPLISKAEDLEELNRLFAQHDAILYIRLHPAQDVSAIRLDAFSNIRICDNAYLAAHHLSLYALLTETDALISDYSSIYFDYLLLDKPIALSVSDFDTYVKYNGLIADTPERFKDAYPSVFLNTFRDLEAFALDVFAGTDTARTQRDAARQRYMGQQTAHASADIVDYMEKNYNLR